MMKKDSPFTSNPAIWVLVIISLGMSMVAANQSFQNKTEIGALRSFTEDKIHEHSFNLDNLANLGTANMMDVAAMKTQFNLTTKISKNEYNDIVGIPPPSNVTLRC